MKTINDSKKFGRECVRMGGTIPAWQMAVELEIGLEDALMMLIRGMVPAVVHDDRLYVSQGAVRLLKRVKDWTGLGRSVSMADIRDYFDRYPSELGQAGIEDVWFQAVEQGWLEEDYAKV